MNKVMDKTSEIENRLKQITITPDCTCIFFKASIYTTSLVKICNNCEYASFNNKKEENDNKNGWCTFKSIK